MTPIDWEQLDRYLAGEGTPEERTRMERRLAEDAGLRRALAALRAALDDAAGAGELRARKAAAWARLERSIGATPARVPARLPEARGTIVFPRAGRPYRPFVRAAAVLVVVAGAALAARAALRGGADGGEAPTTIVSTARGERATVRLPDGSRVTLAAASTLRYPAAFSRRGREVHLDGEAYFDVAHDERRPFVVRAGGAVAEDLGTAFVVRAYPDDSAVRVVVTSGKVALRAASAAARQARVLGPGDLGRQGARGVATVERVDTAAYLAWTRGGLAFDETPLPDALAQLERWHDVEFQLADSALRARRFTGAFAEGASLGSILDAMTPPLDARYERRGRVVVLFPLPPAT
jgi:transmembrane sensor